MDNQIIIGMELQFGQYRHFRNFTEKFHTTLINSLKCIKLANSCSSNVNIGHAEASFLLILENTGGDWNQFLSLFQLWDFSDYLIFSRVQEVFVFLSFLLNSSLG